MSNGSESLPEYPGRPDYTALIEEARGDFRTMPDWTIEVRLVSAVEALREQLAAAEAQLAGMTEEWGYGVKDRQLGAGDSEAEVRRVINYWPEHHYLPFKRLVGQWTEVSEGGDRD